MIVHFEAAMTAVVKWWMGMSDVEKRLTRQRIYSVAASAAVFAFGGQIVAHRFDVQKTEEAWRADAISFNTQLASDMASRRIEAAPQRGQGLLVNAAYTMKSSANPASAYLPPEAAVRPGIGAFITGRLAAVEREPAELDCLARAVYYEARSEAVRGQIAVAEVVINRVHDSRFPKTVCRVVYQQARNHDLGCQFTFTCDGSEAEAPAGPAWDRAKQIALHVALGMAKPVTNHATHYHTDYVSPYWSAGMVRTAQVGQHIFYRFPQTTPEWEQTRLALEIQAHDSQAYVPAEQPPVAESLPPTLVSASVAAAEPSDKIILAEVAKPL